MSAIKRYHNYNLRNNYNSVYNKSIKPLIKSKTNNQSIIKVKSTKKGGENLKFLIILIQIIVVLIYIQ
jgi:hypothetical protein